MKQVNLTIKIPALPVTIGLVVILALTLFSSVLSTSAETLHRPSADNPNNGVITGCVGSSSPSGQGLLLAGRVITPSNLVSLNPNGTCGTNETAVSWNAQGPKGDKGDRGDPTYVQTVVVSPVGIPTANGTALLAAVAQIAAKKPSSTNGYLVILEPGGYDLGSSSLTLPPFVNLRGSGKSVTSIGSTAGSSGSLTNATLIMSSANEVSDLNIVNNGSSDFNAGVLIKNTAGYSGLPFSTLRNIVLFTFGTGNGEFYGVYSSVTSTEIDDSFIQIGYDQTPASTRKNYGVSNNNSYSMTIRDSQIDTFYGDTDIAVQTAGTVLIQNSTLTADNASNTGRGVSVINASQVTVQNSTLSVTRSLYEAAIYNASGNSSYSTVVQNSTLKATGTVINGNTVDAIYNSGILKIGASEIAGNVTNTGTLACGASYDGNFVAVGAQCV